MSGARRVMVVAGEASGDRHAAGLVAAAKAHCPELVFDGVGGRCLEREGVTLHHRAEDLGVVGISEVLARLGEIRAALKDLKRRVRETRPDALLLVDFPDFNLMLAKAAVAAGVPVVWFISPQLWAWRSGRVKVIRERVRRMIVFFPFERDFYREHGVPVTYAGHPLAGTGRVDVDVADARRRLGLDPGQSVYGLLPGSRRGEIERHLTPMLETARRVLESDPGAAFLLPVADTLSPELVDDPVAASGLPVVALRGAFTGALDACDAALVASGTATLEVALRGVPPVVVYKTSTLTYWIGRMAVKVPYVSLVNLVVGRGLVPELLQAAFTPESAAAALLEHGRPGPTRDAVLAGLVELGEKLGGGGAYERAAEALLAELDLGAHDAETGEHAPEETRR